MTPSLATLSTLALDAAAKTSVDRLLEDLLDSECGARAETYATEAAELARSLPNPVLAAANTLSEGGDEPALLITGMGVDDRAIGPTPATWSSLHPLENDSPTRREELLLLLVAQSLGDAFGYESLQGGCLIHNVMPVAGAEQDQSGHSSDVTLAWHTEDAFTPFRADFIGILGLRNPGQVATTLASVSALQHLDADVRRVLAEPRFEVVPDGEHLKARVQQDGPSIFKTDGLATQTAVLYEGVTGTQMVIDRVYMTGIDDEASQALRLASDALDASLEHVPIRPGDILLIDNRRAVHGRDRFVARHDGSDRWLLKTSVTTDWARTVDYRLSATSRIIR